MASDDNLAGRLFIFISAGRAIDGNRNLREVLAGLLNAAADDQAGLLRRVARLVEIPSKLANEVRQAAKLDDADPDLHLRWKAPVEAMFWSFHFNANWASAIQHINDGVMQNLEFCDHLLHRRLPEKRLPTEKLMEIRSDLEALFAETRDADIHKTVKQLILTHLRAMLEALDDFPIGGAPPFEYAVQAAAGTFYVNQLNIYSTAQGAERTALEKFLKVVHNSALFVSLTLNTLQLPPALEYYFKPTSEHAARRSTSQHRRKRQRNPERRLIPSLFATPGN